MINTQLDSDVEALDYLTLNSVRIIFSLYFD
jgi:hypothetical protein